MNPSQVKLLAQIKDRQVQIAAQLDATQERLAEHQTATHARLSSMEQILNELHDDLKLRRWLARFTKSAFFVLLAILGFLHAPQWIHRLFGVQSPPRPAG